MSERKQTTAEYWAARSQSIYLFAVYELVRGLGQGANAIIDVGSAACPYVDWFDWIPHRTSLDLRKPYSSPSVTSIKSDFLEWSPDKYYDIVTCLQVLEHIPDARSFAQKLLSVGQIVVISVPYKWKPGRNTTHVHDPVNEDKLLDWFGRPPNFSYKVREVAKESPRLVHVYENNSDMLWTSISTRNKLINA